MCRSPQLNLSGFHLQMVGAWSHKVDAVFNLFTSTVAQLVY